MVWNVPIYYETSKVVRVNADTLKEAMHTAIYPADNPEREISTPEDVEFVRREFNGNIADEGASLMSVWKDRNTSITMFFDMDGVLAEFIENSTTSDLYSQGYFRNLKPIGEMVNFLNSLCGREDIQVYVLSSYLADSAFALKEKREWLAEFCPNIPAGHKIFVPCGIPKAQALMEEFGCEHLSPDYVLLDDHSQNLIDWARSGGTSIKFLNGINGNGKNGHYFGWRARTTDNIMSILDGICVACR